MATLFRPRWLAAAAFVLASIAPASEAHAQWTYTFNGLFNNNQQTVLFSLQTVTPILGPLAVTPSPCSLTPATIFDATDPTGSTFETFSCGVSNFSQNGLATGLDFLEFGYSTVDADGNGGTGTAFYFFEAGAFSTVGTWNTVNPTTGNAGNAGVATLTVAGQPSTPVPEPTTAVLLAAGLGGLAVAGRRRRRSA